MNKIIILFVLLTAKAEAQTSALAVADSLYAVGNYSEAIQNLEQINPKKEAVHLKLAKFHASRGNPQSAIKNYKIVLEDNPARLLTAINYGKVLMEMGNLESADSLFSVLTEKYPKNASFQYQRGLIKEKQKDSTAIKYFDVAVSLDQTHQAALYKLAKNELKKGRYITAEIFSKQGLGEKPNNVSLLSILAQTYSASKLYKKAVPRYEKLLELGQESEFIYTKLGYAHYVAGKHEMAINAYKRALDFEDMNSNTHYSLGKLYALIGNLEKSEMHLLMAILIKKQPVDAEFLSLGLTYKLQKNHKKALEYFEKALEENPDNERALYERAIAADNYFKDKKTTLNYYQAYLNKYEGKGRDGMIYLAKNRMRDIREELHMKE